MPPDLEITPKIPIDGLGKAEPLPDQWGMKIIII
jgi:hypothetical protein